MLAPFAYNGFWPLQKGRKFGRRRSQRRHFLEGLANNLIVNEKIQTTLSRARELRPYMEKLVTTARPQTLHALRLLLSRLPRRAALKLYYDIGPRYHGRAGGYLRVVKTSKTRKRDSAEAAVIEFVK